MSKNYTMMIRKLLATSCLFLFAVASTAYGQTQIGYMNTQEVLSEMPERASVEQELNGFIEERQQELEQKSAEFQESVAEYQQNQEQMSEEQREQTEQELAETEASLQQYQQTIQQEIQQQQSSLLQPLYEKMDEAINAVAEEKGLDFVLNEATSNGENIIYYSADEQLDITNEVLQQVRGTSN